MTITRTEEENRIILSIEGWLDVQTSPELHEYMQSLPLPVTTDYPEAQTVETAEASAQAEQLLRE